MAYATQQNGFRTAVQSSSRTAPFRAGSAPPQRRRVAVVTQASQDPVGDAAKKAVAAVAAATIALSPLAANAGPLDSVLNQAGAAKDKAAGATKGAGGDNPISNFIDEAKAGADRGIKTAPSIGEAVQNAAGQLNPDAERVAGSARQGAKDVQKQPNVAFSGSAAGLQVNVGLPSPGDVADKAKGAADKASGAAKGASNSGTNNPLQGAGTDTKAFLGQAKDAVGKVAQGGSKDIAQKPIGFSGRTNGLQVNVGDLPNLGGAADKAKGAADKAAGAVKDASNSGTNNPLQGAGTDTKAFLGQAKDAIGKVAQGGSKDIAEKPIGFSGRTNGLQVNVGGLPNFSDTADKAKGAADKAAGAAKDASNSGTNNPLQGAGTDTKAFLGQAKDAIGKVAQGGSKDIAEKPIGFSGHTNGLQVNVGGLPNFSDTADKAKGAADKAAGAAKDASNSGTNNPLQGAGTDTKAFLGQAKDAIGKVAQGGSKDIAEKPIGFSGRTNGLQLNVSGAPNVADGKAQGVKDAAKGGGKEAALQGPAKNLVGKLEQATKGDSAKPAAFSGDVRGLQVNVDAAYGGGGDKPASATDKSTGAAKPLEDQTAGPKTDASGDAKTIDAAKRGIKKLKDQPMVGFNGRTDGLQVNVGFGGLQDKAADAAKTAGNKVQGEAKGAGGGDGPTLGGVADKAKQAIGNVKNAGSSGIAVKPVDFPVKLQDKAKASNETQKRANESKSDGMQRAGADALGNAINKGADAVKKQTGTAYTGATGLQKNVDFPVKLQDKAKASNETQKRANESKSDGMQRAGADALGNAINKGADAVKKQTGTSFTGAAGLQKNVDFPVKLQDKAKASNETQRRANESKSDGMQRAGADALGDVINKGAEAIKGGDAPSLPSLGGAGDKAKGIADKAAGAAKSGTGSGAGPLQGALGDAKNALGNLKQGGDDISTKPIGFSGSGAGLQKDADFPVKLQDKAKASNETQRRANESKSDGMQRPGADALEGVFSKGADAIKGGDLPSLPSLGGAADKAKGIADKAAGAAKSATGSGAGPLQGAAGDAKNALGNLKQGGEDISTKPIGFSGSAAGLQVNVGQTVYGRGETGTFQDQANNAVAELKEDLQNPVQNTKNAVGRAKTEADRVFSNPTGGPEQSKRAAQQLADANAEVPRALSGGLAKAKEAITSPASFNPFGEAALGDGSALEA